MKLPLESITVGKRLREDYGDIAGLAASIEQFGLLHPIVVDEEANLVAGGRRLRAVQMLGWESVDVRDLGELSDAERAEIELEENARRKDLTPYERSKTLVRLAETAKTVLKEQAEFRPDSGRNSMGRPPEPASERAVAERIGVPRQTIQKAQQHVAAAEKYPELQAPTVTQQAATEIARTFDVLPEVEREERREVLRTVGPVALTLKEGEAFPTGRLTDEQKAFYDLFEKQIPKLSRWKHLDPDTVADAAAAETVHALVVQFSDVVEWVGGVLAALKKRETRPALRAVRG